MVVMAATVDGDGHRFGLAGEDGGVELVDFAAQGQDDLDELVDRVVDHAGRRGVACFGGDDPGPTLVVSGRRSVLGADPELLDTAGEGFAPCVGETPEDSPGPVGVVQAIFGLRVLSLGPGSDLRGRDGCQAVGGGIDGVAADGGDDVVGVAGATDDVADGSGRADEDQGEPASRPAAVEDSFGCVDDETGPSGGDRPAFGPATGAPAVVGPGR